MSSYPIIIWRRLRKREFPIFKIAKLVRLTLTLCDKCGTGVGITKYLYDTNLYFRLPYTFNKTHILGRKTHACVGLLDTS